MAGYRFDLDLNDNFVDINGSEMTSFGTSFKYHKQRIENVIYLNVEFYNF